MDEFAAYRPIGLMWHAWKVVDVVFMEELAEDTELFLSPAHDGSRALRGARGPLLCVRMFISVALAVGMEGVLCLLVYSAAFNAIAHTFMDEVLGKSGARVQLRSFYRKVVKAVKGKVKVRAPDGTVSALSEAFDIDRGGIQGGMSTPWIYCVCATELVAEDDALRHDLDFAIRRECLRLESKRSGARARSCARCRRR